MGQFQRTLFLAYRNQVIAVALGLALLLLALHALPVLAQSGCTGDPCVFNTPTATPTKTPAPTPGPGTPTPVPMPDASPFPRPNYGIPTSIPMMSFPSAPSPINISIPAPTVDPWMTPEALPMPGVVSITLLEAPNAISLGNISLTGTEAISLETINTSLSISYSTPLTLGAGSLTGTAGYTFVTGLNDDGRAIISDVVSYTNYLSGEVTALQYSSTLTISTAPDWYAPFLPREMANIGWTFEQVDENSTLRYSLNTWSYLFGAMIAMPIRLARTLLELFRFMGPFGLFLLWLLVIMLPAVLGFKILLFIKNTIIRIINFILTVLDWILKIWSAVPWYFGGPG
ncbi:MAG: hypothetical protein KJ077_05970 [Anaerolineae bacterium]|nr:hypothetical protein [Anaerolineae bacterium]